MRKSSALLTTLVAASALTVAWKVGDIRALEQQSALPLPGPSQPSVEPSPQSTPEGPVVPSSSPSPSSTAKPTSKPTSKPKPPKPQKQTVESDVIDYKYGQIQISLTKVGKEITAVDVLIGDATNGRAKAYEILTQATVQYQGTNYGNVSGATFTTEAFKKAVDNALAKF